MMTQVSAPTPTKDPLTTQDRQIIATIVNQSDYSKNCQPEDVVTIWINSDDIVWVKMTHGYARYHKEPFKRAVAEVKESLSTPLESNQELDEEFKQAAGCYTLRQPQTLTPPAEWDFTLPKFSCRPGAICPDCDGHGCGNCSYRGTCAEDLCTPVDDYRLTYVGRTDIQTAHNMYNDGEFLGILFKVRNAQELWENDPKTYYWRCGDGVKYWSVRDAVVALSKITAVEEVPGVSRELIAA
jgi:hypothetical protein